MINMDVKALVLVVIAVLAMICGCQPVPQVIKPFVLEDDSSLDYLLPVVQYHIGASSVLGRPIIYQTLGSGSDVVFIMATIHGNETAGTPLVHYLSKYLQQHRHLLDGRMVIILPVANPDGMAFNKRYNAHGIDLNRNFAAMNRINNAKYGNAGQSEPESAFIDYLLKRFKPNRIVSIHQPLNCVDYDGPAHALAQAMASKCRLPLKKLGSRPGSLGSYAGETLGIPIITVELLASDTNLSAAQLWDLYGQALLAAVTF